MEYGIIKVIKKEHDLTVNIEEVDIKDNIIQKEYGIDMGDAIPYFKEDDLVKKNINVYTVSKATSDYINFTRFDKYTKFHFFEKKEREIMIGDDVYKKEENKNINSIPKRAVKFFGSVRDSLIQFGKPIIEFSKKELSEVGDEMASDFYDAMGTKKEDKCKKSRKKYVGLFDIDLPLPDKIKPPFLKNLQYLRELNYIKI